MSETNKPAAAPCTHVWFDYGQLGGRNVTWCPHCDTLAWTGKEPEPAKPKASAVPEGWKLVPLEPTPEMKEAALENAPTIIREHYASNGKFTGTVSSMSNEMFGDAYKSMLAAAPSAPQAEEAPAAPMPTGAMQAMADAGLTISYAGHPPVHPRPGFPQPPQPSIDSAEFRRLMWCFAHATGSIEHINNLIAHIDAKLAEANSRADNFVHAALLVSQENQALLARALKAENQLRLISAELKALDRYDADPDLGDGIWLATDGGYIDRDEALSLLNLEKHE